MQARSLRADSTKIKMLKDAGVHVVERYNGIITELQSLKLGNAQVQAAGLKA
jgi:hypothetical protein